MSLLNPGGGGGGGCVINTTLRSVVAFGPVRGCEEVEQPLISLSFEKKKKDFDC